MQQKPQLSALNGFRRSALTLAITTALPATAVYAETIKELPTAQASAQSEDSYKVDRSTSLKYTQPLLDTAKTISVIPQSVMKDRGVTSLRDALRNVPGISMAAGEGGTPTGDQMSIRGFDASNNITIDGVRDIAGYTRDTYNVEAVEVAKGPGSAVYGRGAAGGSINLQSKTAKLEDFNDVTLHLGSESDYRLQLDSNHAIGDTTALRVNLLTDDGEVAGRDEVENSKDAIALSLATGLGTDSRLTVNAEYQKQDNLPDYGLPWVRSGDVVAELEPYVGKAPPVDYSNFYGNTHRDFEDIEAQSLTAKYEKDLTPSTTLRLLGRVGSVERQSIVNAPRFEDQAISTDIGLDHQKTRDTKDSLKVLQFDLIGQYQTGGITHNLVAGIEIAEEKFERWNYDAVVADNLAENPVLVDLYNPDPNIAFTGRYARTGKDQDATGDTTALYVFDTLTLNPQWELSVGLRYDIFEIEYDYDLSDATPAKVDAEARELSWNLGVVYKPADNGSIYFGAGNSFHPTSIDLTPSTRGNSVDLDPEKTISYELGTKWELFNGRLFASAAIFRTEKTDALTDAPDDFFLDDDGRFDLLEGKQRVDGLELSAAGQITEQLSITAAYTFQDSEVDKALGDDEALEGSELGGTPEHSFSVWGRYDVNSQLAFGLGAQYIDDRLNRTSTTASQADDYLIWDMMISYQINDQWGVQLNGSNLTDEEYEDKLGGGHFVPGEGRYVSLSTSYSF